MPIPPELIAHNNWLLWTYARTDDGKETKWPISPRTLRRTDVTDTASLVSYNEAVNLATANQLGIGFVLTPNDPFFCIDLDDPNKNATEDQANERIAIYNTILEQFNTYVEYSPSGKGMHVWGTAPGLQWERGHRRNGVEIYNRGRFFTITGRTWRNAPIVDCSYPAQRLWEECGDKNHVAVDVQEEKEIYTDQDIYQQAQSAVNGAKFQLLWDGDFAGAGYPSASEADFALINMLGFYSRNRAQIKRLFRLSTLAKRSDKAKRDKYVDDMITRSFDNQVPLIPIDKLIIDSKSMLSAPKEESMLTPANDNPFAGPLFAGVPDPDYDWTLPPGLLGEIATFIYEAAPRPVKEIALAGAIGLMAGICGRSYNISNTGLNQYVLLLAGTGTGKEAAASGIDKLIEHVKLAGVPSITGFLGPTDIASGPALIRTLQTSPCFVSIVGEFGLALQNMCGFYASTAQVSLRKKLLELYNKSGEKDVLQPSVYSEKERNTQVIKSPSFSLLGESTPETYFAGIDDTMIQQGLLPRFLCIEYRGPRVELNENHQFVKPKSMLIDGLKMLAQNAMTLNEKAMCIHLKLDADATAFSRAFNKETDARINDEQSMLIAKELWNRAHLKMLKLAALIAIGINPFEPLVTLECVKWAHTLVTRDTQSMMKRFETGALGSSTGEHNQVLEVVRVIRDFMTRPYDITLEKYGVNPQMKLDHVIMHSYLQRRLLPQTSFKNDRMGATNALKRCIEALVNEGTLIELKPMQVYQRYNKQCKAYIVANVSQFT